LVSVQSTDASAPKLRVRLNGPITSTRRFPSSQPVNRGHWSQPKSGFERSLNADFRGRENNQSVRSRRPRFLGDLVILAL
jgi:hypothetical protein